MEIHGNGPIITKKTINAILSVIVYFSDSSGVHGVLIKSKVVN